MNQILLEWAVTASLLIVAVIVLRSLLGRRVSAKLRYALWAVVLVRLLIPVQLFPVFSAPLVTAPMLDLPAVSTAAPLPGQDASVPVPSYELPEPTLLPDGTYITFDALTAYANRPTPPAIGQILGGIWLAGSLVMAAAFVVSNVRFSRRLKRARTLLRDADCFLCAYVADGLPSPCLFGLIHPAIYVTPEAAADEAMLCHVLAHEYTHFRHGDHIWNALRSAALAIHWWNPLVWLAVVLSRRDCELACDEGALARLGEGERIAYGRTLVALLTEKPRAGDLFTCATTMTSGQKSVFDRVTRIARAPKRWLWAAVVIVIAAGAACVFAFGTAAEPEPDSDPKETPRVEVWVDLDTVPDYNPWPDSSETKPEYWSGITFRWTQDAVTAIKDGQETVLYSLGVIIQSVYLTDLNGDGYPEFCSTLADGNYKFIVVYDYENSLSYTRRGEDGNICFLRLEDDGVSLKNALWAVEQSPDGEELRAGPLVLTADGLGIETPYALDPDPLDSLTLSPAQGDGSGDVHISGFAGGSYMDWSLDTSPSQGQLYFAGELSDFCPLSGYTVETGSAIWTDETRSAVSVTMGVNRESTESGSASEFMVHFTVNTNLGTVTAHTVSGPDGELLALTDDNIVDMARFMGRLLAAAEAYYYTQPSAPETQLDPVFAMDNLGTYVEITNLGGPASGVWYPARTNSYNGAPVDPYLALTEPEFLGERFMELYHGCDVYYWPEDFPDMVRLDLYSADYALDDRYSISLTTGPVDHMGFSESPLTDQEWIDVAQALADLYVQAADYYAEASILPTEEGPLPFDTAMTLWFGSGAGAWNTILTLHPDGSFEGDYHDADMGDSGDGYQSTEYVCRFHGRFGDITQVTPASWSMTLEELVIDTGHPIGEKWIEPLTTYPTGSEYKVRYISSNPHGLDDRDGQPLQPGAQFMFYTPDASGYRPTDELYGFNSANTDYDSVMYQFWTWMPYRSKIGAWGPDTRLGCYGLCNMETGFGFFDLYAWGIL